jgi:site-specific recombinase XerD
LGPQDIRVYQVYLTNEKKLAPGSIVIAVSALRFLYKTTLKKHWLVTDIIPAPNKPQTLLVVLSPEEVVRFLDAVKKPKHRTILTTCYAAGLRISEAVHLTAAAIDSQRMVLRIAARSLRHGPPRTARGSAEDESTERIYVQVDTDHRAHDSRSSRLSR